MRKVTRYGQLGLALFREGVEITPPSTIGWKALACQTDGYEVFACLRLEGEPLEIVGRLQGRRGCKTMFYWTEILVDGAFIPFGESHTSIKDALLTLQRGYGLINFWDLEDLG